MAVASRLVRSPLSSARQLRTRIDCAGCADPRRNGPEVPSPGGNSVAPRFPHAFALREGAEDSAWPRRALRRNASRSRHDGRSRLLLSAEPARRRPGSGRPELSKVKCAGERGPALRDGESVPTCPVFRPGLEWGLPFDPDRAPRKREATPICPRHRFAPLRTASRRSRRTSSWNRAVPGSWNMGPATSWLRSRRRVGACKAARFVASESQIIQPTGRTSDVPVSASPVSAPLSLLRTSR
jgi:hypothetical protein